MTNVLKMSKQILAGLIMLIVLSIVILLLLKIKPSTVISDSMYPNIKKHSLVFIKHYKDPNNDLKEGDIVLIKAKTPFIHRIIDVKEVDGITYYETKGDNNETSDGVIKASEVIGIYKFKIPMIGIVFSNTVIRNTIIGVIVFIIAYQLFVKVKDEEEGSE